MYAHENVRALGVSQLNEYIKALVDGDEVLSAVAVKGEISNFKDHRATGHFYFSLKDASSLIKCVMFRSYASRVGFAPKDGDEVVLFGRISVFPRDGVYQIYVSSMLRDGAGDEHAAFERLKEKLSAEGLFDPARKRPVPRYPRKIGIVTSQTGAAVRDLLSILARRYPIAEVVLYPALVQGVDAPRSVMRGIKYFNTVERPDVIIIGRGGGSGEDLSGFNDEALARAVAASGVPVISAVGHETDFTITDFVADLRAPTPSAAAELAVPDSSELALTVSSLADRCALALGRQVSECEKRLASLRDSAVFTSPQRILESRESALLRLDEKLTAAYRNDLSDRLQTLAEGAARLEAMSPLAVIARGYGVVRHANKAVCTVGDLSAGDGIEIILEDGRVDADVTEIHYDKRAKNGK